MAAVFAAAPPRVTSSDRLTVTVFFAVCVHLFVVLGVTFVKEERSNKRANSMDVVLVQRKSEEAPDKADFLGQENQQGSGNQETVHRPATPVPAPLVSSVADVAAASPPIEPSPEIEALPTLEPTPAQSVSPPPSASTTVVAQREVPTADEVPEIKPTTKPVPSVSKQSTTNPEPVQRKTTTKVAKSKPTKHKDPKPQPQQRAEPQPVQTLNAAALVRRSLAMASLSAEVDKRLEAYAKRPRRKWISASTRAHHYAAYMEAWRAKVERVGNLNYPDEARRHELSGNLLLDVALRADGGVEHIIVRRSSGHKVLDDAAVRIVKLAAPFARLPKNIRAETDILHIERTWRFLSSNRFASR